MKSEMEKTFLGKLNVNADIILALAFLALTLFSRPFLLFWDSPHLAFVIGDRAAFAYLALIMIAWKWYRLTQMNKYILFAASVFVLSAISRFFMNESYRIWHLMEELSFIVCPLAIALYCDSFKKLLLPFMTAFWMLNLLYCLHRLPDSGLPGNMNWHASFLVVCTLFCAYALWIIMKKNETYAYFEITIVAAIGTFYFIRCQSRGATISFFATAALYAWMSGKLSLKKIIAYGIALLLLFTLVSLKLQINLRELLAMDIRPPLFKAALRLFFEYPILGVGIPGYEHFFSFFRDESYFLRSHYFALRSPHPHNEALLALGAFGFPAAVAWLTLVLAPLVSALRKYSSLDNRSRLCLFSAIFLFLHSNFDLTLNVWPNNYLFMIFTGILLGENFIKNSDISVNEKISLILPIQIVKIVIVLVLVWKLANEISWNIKYSVFYRYGLKDSPGNQIKFFLDEALKRFKERAIAQDVYDCAVIALKSLNDSKTAKEFLDILETQPCSSVGHSYAYKAACLLNEGKKEEALDYLDKELKKFPISIVALHNKMMLENELGLINERDATLAKLFYALDKKGLSIKDLPKIMKNPYLDDKFNELNPQTAD